MNPLTFIDEYGDTGIIQDPDTLCEEHHEPLLTDDYGTLTNMCIKCVDNYEPPTKTFDEALGQHCDRVERERTEWHQKR